MDMMTSIAQMSTSMSSIKLQQGIFIRAVAVDDYGNGRTALAFQGSQPLNGHNGHAPAVYRHHGEHRHPGGHLLRLHRGAEVDTFAHAGAGNGGCNGGASPGGAEYGGNPVVHTRVF